MWIPTSCHRRVRVVALHMYSSPDWINRLATWRSEFASAGQSLPCVSFVQAS